MEERSAAIAAVSGFQRSAEWADLCCSRWGLGRSVMRVREKPDAAALKMLRLGSQTSAEAEEFHM